MKTLILKAILLLCTLTAATANAQNTVAKPKLFSNFPDKISCPEQELHQVFTASVNQSLAISFSNDFIFNGIVTSNVVKYSNLQTAVIKSAAFDGAILVLSKISNADGSINYVGHIINTRYFDGYELQQDAANNYQLTKIETDKVIQVCSQQ